jgi:hypothetical protein
MSHRSDIDGVVKREKTSTLQEHEFRAHGPPARSHLLYRPKCKNGFLLYLITLRCCLSYMTSVGREWELDTELPIVAYFKSLVRYFRRGTAAEASYLFLVTCYAVIGSTETRTLLSVVSLPSTPTQRECPARETLLHSEIFSRLAFNVRCMCRISFSYICFVLTQTPSQQYLTQNVFLLPRRVDVRPAIDTGVPWELFVSRTRGLL